MVHLKEIKGRQLRLVILSPCEKKKKKRNATWTVSEMLPLFSYDFWVIYSSFK